ncbi:MAG: hypothetical protein R3C24_05365 [Cyanobacteriota/Melainabacteria group bacterium]
MWRLEETLKEEKELFQKLTLSAERVSRSTRGEYRKGKSLESEKSPDLKVKKKQKRNADKETKKKNHEKHNGSFSTR